MQWYHAVIIILAVLAYLSAGNIRPENGRKDRSRTWVVMIAGAYVLSVIYAKFAPDTEDGDILRVAVAFVVDAIVFKIIDETHQTWQEKWGPRLAMGISATVNIVQLTALILGYPPPLPMWLHGSALELITALAFLWIGGYGVLDWARKNGTVGFGIMGILRHHLATVAIPICEKGERQTNVSQPLRKWR